jgi:hypothetical protein
MYPPVILFNLYLFHMCNLSTTRTAVLNPKDNVQAAIRVRRYTTLCSFGVLKIFRTEDSHSDLVTDSSLLRRRRHVDCCKVTRRHGVGYGQS